MRQRLHDLGGDEPYFLRLSTKFSITTPNHLFMKTSQDIKSPEWVGFLEIYI
jgi:hypothetical protein